MVKQNLGPSHYNFYSGVHAIGRSEDPKEEALGDCVEICLDARVAPRTNKTPKNCILMAGVELEKEASGASQRQHNHCMVAGVKHVDLCKTNAFSTFDHRVTKKTHQSKLDGWKHGGGALASGSAFIMLDCLKKMGESVGPASCNAILMQPAPL